MPMHYLDELRIAFGGPDRHGMADRPDDETVMDIPSRMPQNRTRRLRWESLSGLKCQI